MTKPTKEDILSYGRIILMLTVGSFIYSLGVNLFYSKAHLLSGGATGIALLVNYYFGIPTSLMILAINIPLFVLGWFFVSRRFVVLSAIGMGIFSGMIQLLDGISVSFESPLVAIVLGGSLVGIGLGIILRTGVTVGGSDIIGKIMHKYFSVNMAVCELALNALIVGTMALIYGLDQAVMTICAMFLASKVTSYCIDGIDHRRAIVIVTAHKDEVASALMNELGRGVTVLPSEGAYTGQKNNLLYCVISKRQIQPMKRAIKKADPHAFFTILMATGVYGHGHSFVPLNHIED